MPLNWKVKETNNIWCWCEKSFLLDHSWDFKMAQLFWQTIQQHVKSLKEVYIEQFHFLEFIRYLYNEFKGIYFSIIYISCKSKLQLRCPSVAA